MFFNRSITFIKETLCVCRGSFSRLYTYYTRYLCILMRKHIGTPFFVPGVVLGYSLGKKYVFDWPNTTHTHNTHIHTIFWCVVFRCPGGGNECRRVCVLLQRAFTNDKACLFNIASHFRYSNHDVTFNSALPYLVCYTLRLRRYTPPNAHEQYVHVKLRYVSAQSLTFVRFELRLLRTYTTSTQQLFYALRSSHNAYTLSITLIYPPRICASRLGLRPRFSHLHFE